MFCFSFLLQAHCFLLDRHGFQDVFHACMRGRTLFRKTVFRPGIQRNHLKGTQGALLQGSSHGEAGASFLSRNDVTCCGNGLRAIVQPGRRRLSSPAILAKKLFYFSLLHVLGIFHRRHTRKIGSIDFRAMLKKQLHNLQVPGGNGKKYGGPELDGRRISFYPTFEQ